MTKLLVGICPHDIIHDPEKWTTFTAYLVNELQLKGKFEKYFSFETFAQQFKSLNFIYAHPLHAVQLKNNHQFVPLAKYSNKFDEAVIICRKTQSYSGVSDIEGKKVALAPGSPSHAALLIDFNRNRIKSNFLVIAKQSYPEIAAAVSLKEVEFGVILKEVWDQMSPQYPGLGTLYTTFTKELVHVFMISPELQSLEAEITAVLTGMTSQPLGKEILQRLDCSGLEVFSQQDLKQLEDSLAICQF